MGRHPSDSELLRAMARGITTMASLQNEKVLRDRSEKSVLGKLSDRQNSLFTLLSAEDWEDHHPRLNPAATKPLSSQNPEKQWNLISDWAMRWPGRVSKSGVIQFLAKGCVARDLPGGFTAFMFSPMRHMIEDLRDRKRNIKMTYDKDGSALDEEALTFYSRNDYHVPSSIEEAEVQLEMTLLMLEKMTSERSIATDGYLEGQILLREHRHKFFDVLQTDPLFMGKYIHFLDVVFNTFCNDLAECHLDRQPVRRARNKLRGTMRRAVQRKFDDMKYGTPPVLPLPHALHSQDSMETVGKEKKTKASSEPGQTPLWHETNPGKVKEWTLPDGKDMNIFLARTDEGKANLAHFPKVTHHRSKKQIRVCVKCQALGKCTPDCPFTHIRPEKMSTRTKKATDEAFKKAYST